MVFTRKQGLTGCYEVKRGDIASDRKLQSEAKNQANHTAVYRVVGTSMSKVLVEKLLQFTGLCNGRLSIDEQPAQESSPNAPRISHLSTCPSAHNPSSLFLAVIGIRRGQSGATVCNEDSSRVLAHFLVA
jgi:hypothetical protein